RGGRDCGLIDWDAIEDGTRTEHRLPTWDSPSDIISGAADQYREDLWRHQLYQPLIGCEKAALFGTLEPVADELRVPLRALRGNASTTALYDIGKDFERIFARGGNRSSSSLRTRASHHSAQLEIELTRRNIPFVKYGGLKFLEAAHIKDVLSILRWCENPRDRVAGFRAVQLLPGIGPSTAAKILDQVEAEPHATDVLYRIRVPKAAAQDWPAFAKLVEQTRQRKMPWPAEFELVHEWYAPPLDRIYDDAPLRAADVAQLGQIAAGYGSRERFLTELTLDPPDATSGRAGADLKDEDYTILSTIHSAKGQEWRIVRI